jgi:hypothetical protein
MSEGNGTALVLEPIQIQLHAALKAKSVDLARMYVSALHVLSQTNNEDCHHLAAHAIREMMGKLPDVIDVPMEDGAKQRLGDFVNNVSQEWTKMCSKSRWPGDPKWEGDVDGDLKKFLVKIENMLEAEVRIKKGRKTVVQSVIRKQNFSSVPLPSDIEDLRTKEWIKYQDYFTQTAHYKPTDEPTFLGYLKHFEYFLLNCLEPRTFEVQDDIKKIIEEGESNAK